MNIITHRPFIYIEILININMFMYKIKTKRIIVILFHIIDVWEKYILLRIKLQRVVTAS